jgi:protocatechuate 3,4-dioxygenase, alpha subunit
MSLHATSSQTVGPYFSIGLSPLYIPDLAGAEVEGERITLQGRVIDGDGNAVPDAMIEIWQANASGKYASDEDTQDKPLSPGFRGFGRVPTNNEGGFRLTTIKPGRVPGLDGTLQAPHLVALVYMRGLLRHLVTRVYFSDEPSNADDSILLLVPSDRRGTLIARTIGTGVFEWNVILQGQDETVFFDA